MITSDPLLATDQPRLVSRPYAEPLGSAISTCEDPALAPRTAGRRLCPPVQFLSSNAQ